MTPEETLLTFPCDFPIKAMGLANDAFESAVLTIIKKHVPTLKENAIRTRYSKDKKYISMTITIRAESQTLLDSIYQDLTSCDLVLVGL